MVLPVSTFWVLAVFALIRLGLLSVSAYGLYMSVIEPNLDYYVQGYLNSQYESQGALIRVAFACCQLWRFFSTAAVFSLPLM